jgi:N-acyl-D-aspartate/D-glutamate deacylase
MVELLGRSLAEGGLGYSTSVSPFEHDADGRPVPASFAGVQEYLALARETGRYEGTTLQFAPNAGAFTDETVELMIGMSCAADRPLNWNVIFVAVQSEDVTWQRLAVSDLAAARGACLVGLAVPDSSAMRLNFVSGVLFDALPVFEELMRLDPDDRLAVLSSPAARSLLRQGADSPNGRAMYYLTDWGSFTVGQTFSEANEGLVGRRVRDIAVERGIDDFDCLLDIVVADGLRTVLVTIDRGADELSWKLRQKVLTDPRVVVGGSDAGAHLDMLDTFNLATSFLGPTVRQRKLLPLETAVHLMTQAPARLLGLVDRGVVAEGKLADLFVFDPETLGPGPVQLRSDLPAHGSRLYSEPTGVHHVLVNGVEIVSPDGLTGARPGSVLRSGRDTRTVTNTEALAAGLGRSRNE